MSDNVQKLNTTDATILNLVKAYPDMQMSDIARKAIELKQVTTPQAIYSRLSKNMYLRGEIDKVRKHSKEYLSREIVPLALKEHKAALKDKDMSRKDKLGYVKLALDKEFGDDKAPIVQHNTVNIDQIQAVIQQVVDKV